MRVKETIEEAAKRIYPVNIVSDGYDTNMLCRIGFYIGYELSKKRSYSEEEVISLLDKFGDHIDEWYSNGFNIETETTEKWFNKYKKK